MSGYTSYELATAPECARCSMSGVVTLNPTREHMKAHEREESVTLTRAELEDVERAAASKALTDAAYQFATQDGLEVLMFARDDVAAVRVTEKWLIDRAAALGLTAGQEGEIACE